MKVLVIVAGLVIAPFKRKAAEGRFCLASSRKNSIEILVLTSRIYIVLARLRQPRAAFLLNRAITRPATITKTFGQPYPSYMQSFIKICSAVLEKSGIKILTMHNFNKDISSKIMIKPNNEKTMSRFHVQKDELPFFSFFVLPLLN